MDEDTIGVDGYCIADLPSWPVENSKLCPKGAGKDIIWEIYMRFYLPLDLEITI